MGAAVVGSGVGLGVGPTVGVAVGMIVGNDVGAAVGPLPPPHRQHMSVAVKSSASRIFLFVLKCLTLPITHGSNRYLYMLKTRRG